MEQPKLGQLVTGEAYRDAVHVAVAPVEAAEPLHPGDHVRLVGHDYLRDGYPWVQHGSERARWEFSEGDTTREYWRHWSVVTGVAVPEFERESVPVDCSC